MNEIKPEIMYEDFAKLDIRAGTVVSAERVEGSEKLIKLLVDFGPHLGQKQILTGLLKWYEPKEFVGFQTIFILNLPPRKMMGLTSEGMILALGLSDDQKPTLLKPKRKVKNGEGVR
ncbi:MAG: methionine--tRNA ligase subunit beta [Patescibacteria group bacterium]|nr:MAG: methionine--tRNA ligase subunit beta [Patescibacteria group bacterium]